MISPVFFGLRSVFLFAARHAGCGDAVRLAQTTPLATVSRQVPLASPLWAGLALFLLFFALPPACPFGADPAQAAPDYERPYAQP